MLKVSIPGALNYNTLFCLIRLTLYVSTNPTLTHLSLSGFLDFLLCNLITPTTGLAFFTPMTWTLVAAAASSSDRHYPSLNFLPPLFICLIPTLIMQGSTLKKKYRFLRPPHLFQMSVFNLCLFDKRSLRTSLFF